MSEDPAEFEKAILATEKRFEVYVPKPQARLNIGASAKKKDPGGSYGVPGVTLSAKDNVFVEAGLDAVQQTGGTVNELVGADRDTYVGGDIHLTASGDMLMSAAQRVLVISGSHTDPSPRANKGDSIRLQAYNSLAQHYRIDSLQVGLFEFFHGRRDRPKRPPTKFEILTKSARKDKKNPLQWKASKRRKFNHKKPQYHGEIAKDKELQGGFAGLTHKTLYELYPTETAYQGAKNELFFPPNLHHHPTSRAKAQKVTRIKARVNPITKKVRPPRIIQPIEKVVDKSDPRLFIEPLFTNDAPDAGVGGKGLAITAFGGPDVEEMEYGFSRYFQRFDPYPHYKPKAFSSLAGNIVKLQNALNDMRRMIDCLVHATSLPGALSQLIQDAIAAAPVVGPIVGLLGQTLESYSSVMDEWGDGPPDPDYEGRTEGEEEEKNPLVAMFRQPAEDFIKPFQEGEGEQRRASVKGREGPWKLSHLDAPLVFQLEIDSGSVRKFVIDPGPKPARAATLNFTVQALEDILEEDGAVIGSETVEVEIEVDGRHARLAFNSQNAPDGDAIAKLIEAQLGSVAEVTAVTPQPSSWVLERRRRHQEQLDQGLSPTFDAPDLPPTQVQIKTRSVGDQARIQVNAYQDNAGDDDPSFFGLAAGSMARGKGAVEPIADLSQVTSAELLARMGSQDGYIASDVGGALRISSDTVGNGSMVRVSGNVGDSVFLGETKYDKVHSGPLPDWETVDKPHDLMKPLLEWVAWAGTLPDQAKTFLEPITNAVSDLADKADELAQMANAILELTTMGAGPAIPDPPEAVGIFGTQGITMGTHDRIVGQGGHGILFIVDGASGEPDKGKMLKQPEMVARFAGGFDPPMRTKPKQSLGFRVFSDSLVDLTGADAAQLLAMGRAKADKDFPHGSKFGGIGVARVLGSRIAEVAGFEKVIISARSPGDSSDSDALTGGRVEVAGQTIAIGGVRVEDKDADGKEYGPYDFEMRSGVDAHSKSFGIAPLKLKELPMANHLTLHPAKRKKDALGKRTKAKKPHKHLAVNKRYAWPEKLREEHPVTERVHVHSSKEAVIVVGSFMIHVSKDGGVVAGRRKADKDPSKNEVDETLGSLRLTDAGVQIIMPNKDKSDHSSITAMEGQTVLKGADGSGDAGVVSAVEGGVTLAAGSNESLEVSKGDGIKIASSKFDANVSGNMKLKGGQIHIG